MDEKKIIISNAALYGMSKDTHLVGQQYSWGRDFRLDFFDTADTNLVMSSRLHLLLWLARC